MSISNRSFTMLTIAAFATSLAGAAAFAAVPTPSDAATMSGMSAGMEDLDSDVSTEVQALMADSTSVGAMHRWMIDESIDLGQMHGDMARTGMNHGRMHRDMATTAR